MSAPQDEWHKIQGLFTAIKGLTILSSSLWDLDVQVSVLDLEDDQSSHICTPQPRSTGFIEACALTLDEKDLTVPDHEDDPSDGEDYSLRSRYHMALYSNNFLGNCFISLKLREAETKSCLWWQSNGNTTRLKLAYNHKDVHAKWIMRTFYQLEDRKHAHIGCTLVDEVKTDECLSKSELFSVLRVMQNGIERSKYKTSIPVMIYSMRDTDVRIIHAYFKGPVLMMQVSKWITICRANKKDIETYLRWMMNTPKGYELSGAVKDRLVQIDNEPLRWPGMPSC